VTFFFGGKMGKTNYGYEKRKRELEKQSKKKEKLARRQQKKDDRENAEDILTQDMEAPEDTEGVAP